jgi:uncharacterized protein
MDITFLGGASGVGATCQLVTLGQRHVLVDAGVRVDAADRLPDLAALDAISLDAILITHAHADHIGALPLVAARNPATPIYANPATICLIEVMLGDAVRVMARRAAEELEFPLYDDAQVAATLRTLRPLRPGAQQLPELPGVIVSTQRAGHIAGAVSIGLESEEGRLVISGDVSVTPQRTILGAAIPDPRHPNLLVLESTYGARLHPNRAQEERRLAEAVAEVVERGGYCLLPSFALGRAQEVISILRAAQRDGVIPPFPIAVDGLVRRVCAAYAAIPEALTPGLRKHILGGGRPFFGGNVQAIDTPRQRDLTLAGPPGAIVASSGMLTGGPSVFYAERLAGDARSAVLFSGYLDEEAPGRRLLELADTPAAERRIRFGERTVPVACQIGRYNLSAHADGDELAGIVRALAPKSVALVHGDPEARAALAARLRGLAEVFIPQDGQTLAIAASDRGGRRVQAADLPTHSEPRNVGAGAPLDEACFQQLWTALRDGSGVQTLGVRELARAWYGDDAGDDEAAGVAALLEQGTVYFRPLPGAPGLYRLPAPTEVRRALAAQTVGGISHANQGQRINQTEIQAIIDRHLGGAADLYQRSIDPATGTVTLRYFFPDVARERDAEAIAAIAEETSVRIEVSPQPHQGELAAAALAALPDGLTPSRSPAIRLDTRTVELRCAGQSTAADVAATERTFAARTGWRIVLSGLTLDQPAKREAATPTPAEQQDMFVPPQGTPRSEVNWTIQTARMWFGPDTGCYKVGADQNEGVLTLRFHFPDVARARQAAALAEFAAYVGWTVRIWPQVHQEALMQAAREAIPASLTLLGAPAIQSATREVTVRVQGSIDSEQLRAAAERFREMTGWTLVLRSSS